MKKKKLGNMFSCKKKIKIKIMCFGRTYFSYFLYFCKIVLKINHIAWKMIENKVL